MMYDQEKDDAYRKEIEARFENQIIKYDSQKQVKLAIVKDAKTKDLLVVKFCGRFFDSDLAFYRRFQGTNICLKVRHCHRVTGTIFTLYEPRFVDFKTLSKKGGGYKPDEAEKERNFELFLIFLGKFLVLCQDRDDGFIDYADIHRNPSNIGFDVNTKEFVFFEGGASRETWPRLEDISRNFLNSMVNGDKANINAFRHIFPTKLMRETLNQNNFIKTKKIKVDNNEQQKQEEKQNCEEEDLPLVETKLKGLKF
jgi:hypothetical protein